MTNLSQIAATFLSSGLVYGLNGIYTILPLFLSQYFNSVEMGYLLAIPPLVLCIAPLFWGNITDKAKSQNIVMIILIAGATISFCSIPLAKNFYLIVGILLIIYAIFQSSFGSLIDVLTIKAAEKFGMNFGFFRITGTVLYGAMACFVTFFRKTETAFVFYLISAVLACVLVKIMPRVRGVKKTSSKDVDGKSLLKNKELWLLVLIISFPYFAWGFYQNFFPNYITDVLGLDKSLWGIVSFLTAFGELPFFLCYNRIFDKVRLRHVLWISCFAIVIRYITYAFVTNVFVLVVISFITGLFITVLIYCITKYIVAVIMPQLINRAQSIAYAFGTGIPKMLAGCVGGYMVKYLGVAKSFLICAFLVFISMMLVFICTRTMDSIEERMFEAKHKR